MLINNRSLRTRSTKRGARREDKLEVFVGFLIAQNTFGGLQQAAELDEGGDAGADRRLEFLVAEPAEAERTEPCLVGDAGR